MIILASRSKARRDILRQFGIRFRVLVPRVKERTGGARSPAATAMANALLKARDAARRVKKGIVVGCDTFVVQGKGAFGKPANMREARLMLKRLSRRPQVLYSGIAVIDVARGREMVDCEKTKIFMRPLTDAEILRYFRRVSPMDKAGAFDIREPEIGFIRRIEGCYFNVVGIPMAKLAALLRKIGVPLLGMLFAATVFCGCATEYNLGTQRRDLMFYSTDKEVGIGDALSKQVEKEYKVIQDPELNERLRKVGEKIVAVCDRKELVYHFRVIEDKKDPDIVNAVSLPGGYVYVFKNLMKVAGSDAELAAVVGHEVGHVVARHSIKRLQASWGYAALMALAIGTRSPDFAQGSQLAFLELLTGYSQEDELLADRLGARYAKRAGYDPEAMITFLNKLKARHKKEEAQPFTYFRSHPYVPERIRATREEIGDGMSFVDFMNTQR